jgi:hypothetical protein
MEAKKYDVTAFLQEGLVDLDLSCDKKKKCCKKYKKKGKFCSGCPKK